MATVEFPTTEEGGGPLIAHTSTYTEGDTTWVYRGMSGGSPVWDLQGTSISPVVGEDLVTFKDLTADTPTAYRLDAIEYNTQNDEHLHDFLFQFENDSGAIGMAGFQTQAPIHDGRPATNANFTDDSDTGRYATVATVKHWAGNEFVEDNQLLLSSDSSDIATITGITEIPTADWLNNVWRPFYLPAGTKPTNWSDFGPGDHITTTGTGDNLIGLTTDGTNVSTIVLGDDAAARAAIDAQRKIDSFEAVHANQQQVTDGVAQIGLFRNNEGAAGSVGIGQLVVAGKGGIKINVLNESDAQAAHGEFFQNIQIDGSGITGGGSNITPSSAAGSVDDPELHTLTFVDGDESTTWRLVGGTPVDVAAPTAQTGVSFTQYAVVTNKVLDYDVNEADEVFTAQAITVMQTGFTPVFTVTLLDSDGAVATLDSNTVKKVRVTVTSYDNQSSANIRITGDFTVVEGPTSRDFTNIEGVITGNVAPATNVSVSYSGNADIPQYSTGLTGEITIDLSAVNGSFVGTPPTPVVTQGSNTLAISSPTVTGDNTAAVWTVLRNQISAANRDDDVTITWAHAEVIATGKTSAGGDQRIAPSGTLVDIVALSPNNLNATYQPTTSVFNLYALTSSEIISVTYTHNLNPASGTYTLENNGTTVGTFTSGSTAFGYDIENVNYGSNSFQVQYVDDRDSFYNRETSARSYRVVSPWYEWEIAEGATPGIDQSYTVTSSGTIEDGSLAASINNHVLTPPVASTSRVVYVAIPTSTTTGLNLTGTATTGSTISSIVPQLYNTVTQTPPVSGLTGAPATETYNIYQVATILANDSTTIQLILS